MQRTQPAEASEAAAQQPVLLLKTKSLPTDPYELTLVSAGYRPIFLPVLTHSFRTSSLTHLRNLFSSPHSFLASYDAVVLTSQRAVEALDSALSVDSSHSSAQPAQPGPTGRSEILEIWSEYLSSTTRKGQDSNISAHERESTTQRSILPIYVVGPATYISVSGLVAKHFPPGSVRIAGQETGTGEALTEYIQQDLAVSLSVVDYTVDDEGNSVMNPVKRKRILFPTGEKRKDTVPRVLSSAGWDVDEVACYETVTRDEFVGELASTLMQLESERECECERGHEHEHRRDQNHAKEAEEAQQEDAQKIKTVWTIIFSPQGSREFLATMGWLSDTTTTDTSTIIPSTEGYQLSKERALRTSPVYRKLKIKVMSIGPTTEDYLQREYTFQVDAVARKPSAEGVLEGLQGLHSG